MSYLENPSSIVIDRDNVGYVVLFQLRDVLGVRKVAYEQSRDHLSNEYFPEYSFFPFVYLLDNSQRDPFYPVALGNVWKCRYLLPPPQPKSSSHSFNKQLAEKHRWDISSHTFEIFNLSFKKITFTWWLFCSFIPQFVFKENIFAN